MKLTNYKSSNNYSAIIDRTKVYMDFSNKRAKIINTDNISVQNLKRIIHYCAKQHLGKVICNCESESSTLFHDAGFKLEGKINGYFKGKDALCMSYFIDTEREFCSNFSQKESLIRECIDKKSIFKNYNNNFEVLIRNANENDIDEMIKLFSTVFSSYPSPIYDKNFIKETMNQKVLYKVAVYNGKIVSIASADMDKENLNAEITDCATYPDYSNKGILSGIIYSLECNLRANGFMTLYSLSRAINPSINFVLSRHNYIFTGRMVNNCNICGTLEDMNIWVKQLKTQ